MKEYEHDQGYVRETILIFTDPDLEEEKYQKVTELMNDYTGNNGEVIDIKIFKNENGPGAIIWMVIICFKSLLRLLEVTEERYQNYIKNHLISFFDFYNEINFK